MLTARPRRPPQGEPEALETRATLPHQEFVVRYLHPDTPLPRPSTTHGVGCNGRRGSHAAAQARAAGRPICVAAGRPSGRTSKTKCKRPVK
jgi:hypothetical protein